MDAEFGYVILVFVFMYFVYQWMAVQVIMARKKYNVSYPLLYAPDSHPNAKAFNCIQRGHQNSLEGLPFFITLLFLAGVQYPITAAVGGLILVAGRITYFAGYATGVPDRRLYGLYQYIGILTLLGATIASAVKLLRA